MKQNAATPVPVQEWKSAARLIIASLLVYYLRDIWIDMIEAAGSGRSTYGYGPDVPTTVLELCRFIVIFAPILYLIGLRRFRNMLSGPDAASVSKLVVSAGFLIAGMVIDVLPFVPGFLASICRLVAYVLMLVGFGRLRKSESFPEKARRGAKTLFVANWLVIAGWIVGWIPLVGSGIDELLQLLSLIFVLVGWNRIMNAHDAPSGTEQPAAAQPAAAQPAAAQPAAANPGAAAAQSAKPQLAAAGGAPGSVPEVRGYDDARLAEIVAEPACHRPELVDACRHEQEVRRKAAALMPKVEAYSDKKLQIVLTAPRLYSEELIYCAQRVAAGRQRLRAEQEAETAESARLEQEREAALQRAEQERQAAERRAEQERRDAERRARNAAVWRQRLPYLFVALAVAIIVAASLMLTSDGYRYRRAVKFAEAGEVDRAIERLATIDDPTFDRYSSAKYLLYGQYLAKRDSVAAAEALTEAVAAKDWSDRAAYQCYAEHCLEGTFEPYIRKSKRLAADFYACALEEIDRLKGGALYFELNSFKAAREVLESLTYVGTARGYLGIMYLYGRGGLEQDFETAYDYLKDAPNILPFVVHKGDLTLYLRKGSYGNQVSVIEAADSFYATAAALEPDNKAYVDRHEVTSRILEVYRKDDGDWWNRGSVYWHNYSFKGGQYTGQYTMWGNSGGAHGWGFFYGSGNDRWIRLGKYVRCNNAGLGIDITNNYWVSVGKLAGNSGTLVSGVEISPSGAVTKK